MCGRYSITLPPEAIRQIFQTYGELPNWPAYYNAPPTTALPVVRRAKDGSGRELVQPRCPIGWSANVSATANKGWEGFLLAVIVSVRREYDLEPESLASVIDRLLNDPKRTR